jgi:hypothetical protein
MGGRSKSYANEIATVRLVFALLVGDTKVAVYVGVTETPSLLLGKPLFMHVIITTYIHTCIYILRYSRLLLPMGTHY